ncbi:MAG TPA: hypothetical protein VIV88_00520 [Gemmatimonadales bacterium]
MSIAVHIDRLILDGLAVLPGSPGAIGAHVERELSRLLAQGGVRRELERGGAVTTLRGGTVDLAHGPEANVLGRQVARAVYRGIGA